MLSNEVIEKVVERLAVRMEQANEYVLQKMGESVKRIGTLTPTEAHKLVQILKYGGDYDKIIKKIKELTKLNVNDIYKIFDEVAKNDYKFAEQFYRYRNKKYIPWSENDVLRNQVKAMAKITAKKYVDMARTSMIGFGLQDDKGNIIFTGLEDTYNKLLDEAILNVGQGKETFDSAMTRTLKQLGNGLKVIYPSTYITTDDDGNEIIKHRTMRIDSATRMHMNDALRSLHNETQAIFGKEFDSDGVEISVHESPAPDHELVQGRQFSKKQFDNFQNDKEAISYDKITFPPEFEGHDRRSISQYNCYHYTFDIVLGVSEPEYTNEQLQEIIDNNNKGFEFEGKHYTIYEGTQLQRKLETEIRKAKDQQIIAKASDNKELIFKSQEKITILNNKYKRLSVASNLPTKANRLKVSNYKRVAKSKLV